MLYSLSNGGHLKKEMTGQQFYRRQAIIPAKVVWAYHEYTKENGLNKKNVSDAECHCQKNLDAKMKCQKRRRIDWTKSIAETIIACVWLFEL